MKVDEYKRPVRQGLYDPALEKDACGVGYVVSIDGIPSNKASPSTLDLFLYHFTALRCINTFNPLL